MTSTGSIQQSRFDACVGFVLAHETEYWPNGEVKCERDPHDPGGNTKFGIDQRSHPHINICTLTEEEARAIYHDDEWTRCRCADLPPGWDLAVFDAAVNLGKGWAIPNLQRIVGVTADSIIGPKTLTAVDYAGPDRLQAYLDAREAHYRSLRPELVNRYLSGWLNRVADVRGAITQHTGTMAA